MLLHKTEQFVMRVECFFLFWHVGVYQVGSVDWSVFPLEHANDVPSKNRIEEFNSSTNQIIWDFFSFYVPAITFSFYLTKQNYIFTKL